MFNKRILAILGAVILLSAPVPAFAQEEEESGIVAGEDGILQEPSRPQLVPMPQGMQEEESPGAESASEYEKPRAQPRQREHSYIQADDRPGAAIPHLTTNDFLSRVGGAELPVLVQFDAVWCPFCKKLQPHLDDLREKKLGKIDVYKVDADQEGDLMRSYEVGTLPTLIMFYDGRIVGRSDGGLEKDELKDWVEAVEDDIKAMKSRQSKR